MNADDLRRTKSFALRILKLCAALPNTIEGKTIRGQLARAGTSVGANYRSTCRARSTAEFVARIGVVEEEADESGYRLELIIDSAFMARGRVWPLLVEANELTRIMARSDFSLSPNAVKSEIGNWKSEM